MSTFKFNLPQGLLEAAASILESKYHETHKLVDEKTGKEIKIGDKVKDFRGETHEIKGYRPGAHAGSTGRVHTSAGEFYPGVVGAKVVARDDVKEALHPNQQKIDVVDDEKIDAKDFAKLRKMKKMKEEVEQVDEAKKGEKDLNITKAHLNAIAGAKSHDEAKGIYNKLLDDQKTLTPETIAKHRRAVETSKSHGDIVKLAYNAYLKGEGLGVVK